MGGEPSTDQPGSVFAASMVQSTSFPPGRSSLTARSCAVPLQDWGAERLKPFGLPPPTAGASAVFWIETSGAQVTSTEAEASPEPPLSLVTEIGRASCRGRVEISVGAGSLKK